MSTTTSIKAAPPATMDEFNQRYGAKAVTWKALNSVLDTTHGEFVKVLKALKTELAEARHEIAQLKARPLQKWAGVHVTGMQYSEASLVTRGGSLWVATTPTTSTPGEAGGDWRLIVKKGHA